MSDASPDERDAIRQVFLRLVSLGEGREDTRRRVARSELDRLGIDPGATDTIVERYGRARLLTFDRDPVTREPTVEVAHEALLTGWPRFRRWIDRARDDLRREGRLAQETATWEAAERDPSYLLRGAHLEATEDWIGTTDLTIGTDERAFVHASATERDRELAVERDRTEQEARTERRARRRLRGLVAVFAVAALVAGTLTVVANDQRSRADSASAIATAREIAAAATAVIDEDPELAILLAMEAIEASRSANGSVIPEAEQALHDALSSPPLLLRVPDLGGQVAWSPHGVFVATETPASEGIVEIRDDTTGQTVSSFDARQGPLTDAAFSPDGTILVTAGSDGSLVGWGMSTEDELWRDRRAGATAIGISFDGDGSTLSVAWNGSGTNQVEIFDASTGRLERTIRRVRATDTQPDPQGRRVAIASESPPGIIIVDLATGRRWGFNPLGELQPWGGGGAHTVAWDPDGRFLARGGFWPEIDTWDPERPSAEPLAAGPQQEGTADPRRVGLGRSDRPSAGSSGPSASGIPRTRASQR